MAYENIRGIRMKVALLAFSVRGAMGQYIEALVQALSHHVHVDLFVPTHYDGDSGQAEVHRFVTGKSKSGAFIRFLNLWNGWRLWKRIKMISPDVLHIFNGEGYPWTLLIAYFANREKIPLIVTVHDPEPHPGNPIEAINAFLRRFVVRHATLVHIHSERFINHLTKQGISPHNIRVIPHGSFAPRFTRWKRQGIKREKLALFFGRIEAYKGVDVLVKAGLVLNGKVKIAIAGPGRLSLDLKRTILSRPDIFELHNRYLSEQEVAELFQRASVCVLPYRQATQSSVPLIAAAFGVPVVATSVGAFVEDVPRVGGIVVPPNNAKALAKTIWEALDRQPTYPEDLEFSRLVDRFVTMYQEGLNAKS